MLPTKNQVEKFWPSNLATFRPKGSQRMSMYTKGKPIHDTHGRFAPFSLTGMELNNSVTRSPWSPWHVRSMCHPWLRDVGVKVAKVDCCLWFPYLEIRLGVSKFPSFLAWQIESSISSMTTWSFYPLPPPWRIPRMRISVLWMDVWTPLTWLETQF